MQKAKGEVLIAIGSVLMIIGAIFGILMGILVTFAGAWIWNILGAMDGMEDVPGLSGVLMAAGAVIGIVIVIFAVLSLIFGIMCFKRKGDPNRSTFPLVIGIIFTLFALTSVLSAFSLPTLISLAAPVLILIGAILNKQQAKVMVPYAGYSPQPGQPYPPMPEQPYPPQQAPYQPPYQPMPEQQPYQPPYEQPPSEE
jgi:hypothetical protein